MSLYAIYRASHLSTASVGTSMYTLSHNSFLLSYYRLNSRTLLYLDKNGSEIVYLYTVGIFYFIYYTTQ